jgi:O-antigen/teichoic acid export membrane protein
MLATVAALAAAFLFTFVPLRDITRTKTKSVQLKDLTNYTTPVFLITFIVLTFYSIDVLIAKAVFPDELAGTYAMASLLAKTIFIGTLPISKAMFPLTAGKKKSRSESPQKLFTHALALLGLCIAIALALFYFLADWIIRIFAGRVLPEAAAVLPLIAIAISLISISNLVILYKLSRGQTRGYKNFILLLIVEVFLLIHFSSSLLIFSLAFILASAIFLWASIMLLRR